MAPRNARHSSSAGGFRGAELWRWQYCTANFCGARVDSTAFNSLAAPAKSVGGSKQSAAPKKQKQLGGCQIAADQTTYPETPTRALLLGRPPRADESALFGTIREQAANTSRPRRDRQPPAAQKRTTKGRYVFFSHCSVRLTEPLRGFPAVVKSLNLKQVNSFYCQSSGQ